MKYFFCWKKIQAIWKMGRSSSSSVSQYRVPGRWDSTWYLWIRDGVEIGFLISLDLKIEYWNELTFFLNQKFVEEELLAIVNACSSKWSEDEICNGKCSPKQSNLWEKDGSILRKVCTMWAVFVCLALPWAQGEPCSSHVSTSWHQPQLFPYEP